MKASVFLSLAASLALCAQAFSSAFSVDRYFGDHMVLQRGKPVTVGGEAPPECPVTGNFRGETASATAGKDGRWTLAFPAGEAGGPFELTVSTPVSSMTFRDVMVGEVWFCSGQSNMEYPVWNPGKFWGLPEGEAVAGDGDSGIRLYKVPHAVAPDGPCDSPPGRPEWRLGDDAAAVKPFSAVAWFFGRELRRRLGRDVPVGLVESCWGGTLIQPWISEITLAANDEADTLGKLAVAKAKARITPDEEARRLEASRRILRDWLRDKYFAPHADASAKALATWARPELPPGEDAQWRRGPRASGGGLQKVGVTWHRREFSLPGDWSGREAVLTIQTLDDCDETFIDGEKIGETGIDVPEYWNVRRVYRFTIGATEGGRHVLAIRQQNHFMTGRFSGPVSVALADGTAKPVELQDGEWAERVEFHVDPAVTGVRPQAPQKLSATRFSQQLPTTLFNAMVAPFVRYPMRGAIWYQGCSNAGEPGKYRDFQREIVEDWRRAWNDPEFVFIGTQLSAFAEHRPSSRLPDGFWKSDAPGGRPGYAPIRYSQTVLLDMPGCGLACAIDVGDHSDIHPSRKKPVGERLAHEAMRLAYGDAAAMPGPRGASAVLEGPGKVRVTLSDSGEGIELGGSAAGAGHPGPQLFALFRSDGTGEWADAEIQPDGTILVTAPAVADPVRVEYAWSAYPPDPCLYRKGDGIPVFPFKLGVGCPASH